MASWRKHGKFALVMSLSVADTDIVAAMLIVIALFVAGSVILGLLD